MIVFRCLYFQITIALLLITQTTSTEADSCITSERSALLHFKAGLSDPANFLSSWEGHDCCRWKGVGCSNRTGHVVKLDLQGPPGFVKTMLGGNISSSLLGLQHLRYLDLSRNWFSGLQVPDFLSSLHSLRYLSLLGSDFAGRIPSQLGGIPSGNQLQALDDQESIYVGNPGLCGPMISKKCLGTKLIPATLEHHEDVNDTVSFLIAMGSGCVMGLWVVFCTFLFKRKWRICWFSFCDSLYDRVYVQVAVGWASRTRHNTVGRS
ncbi:hypothetical protein QYE76_013422 [Lolium multiflorum]|uniref:Leucine-rich repeat-containing N-terminal plant-type domain-containing protein n=1 Tax=Lolium multiflorum TaxID=4521 RepID=A0AAD8X5W3_LOLMU|nr:hypothetical protein QYE76_013422 [Lolium multiflorum]